ncbi:MAG: general secretion pathway protein GspK [Deltaproteobacteria bacterium]|nr:general secretion pathway protein GspK [Deltaproteobacteria bacterium]
MKNERGMALILVLSAITILSVAAVEFAYNTNVAYQLAVGEKNRLQATYLARSAFEFMRLELKYDRVFRQIVQQQGLGQMLGDTAQMPLCQQFPLSTGLVRMVFLGGGVEGEAIPEDVKRMVSMSEEEQASSFLDFEGDFDATCIDEATKFNLNTFSTMNPDQTAAEGQLNSYWQYRLALVQFLKNPKYAALFELADVTPEDAVRNIADWIDPNDMIDESPGRTGGPEGSLYERAGMTYQVKNGKLLSLAEAYQIVGVSDDWYSELKNNFTVYGDGKVNICSSERPVIEAVIRRYVGSMTNPPPIRLEDPEVMDRLVQAVGTGCQTAAGGDQQVQAVSASLTAALNPATEGGTQGQVGGRGGVDRGLQQLITGSTRFFTLTMTGQVDQTTVKMTAVVDTQNANATQWPVLYWKVY